MDREGLRAQAVLQRGRQLARLRRGHRPVPGRQGGHGRRRARRPVGHRGDAGRRARTSASSRCRPSATAPGPSRSPTPATASRCCRRATSRRPRARSWPSCSSRRTWPSCTRRPATCPSSTNWAADGVTNPIDQQLLEWLGADDTSWWIANYTPVDLDVNGTFVMWQKMMAGEIDVDGAVEDLPGRPRHLGRPPTARRSRTTRRGSPAERAGDNAESGRGRHRGHPVAAAPRARARGRCRGCSSPRS